MTWFGANWKTTVTGGLQALFGAVVSGTLTFPSDWSDVKQVGLFAFALIGTFFGLKFAAGAKSKEVTGGTVQQTVSGEEAVKGSMDLVDATVLASIKSKDTNVTAEQMQAVNTIRNPLQ